MPSLFLSPRVERYINRSPLNVIICICIILWYYHSFPRFFFFFFRILGGTKQLKLPSWGSGMCLMDYAPLVHQLLEEKVQSLVQSYVQRKEFTAAFLSVFGQAVLEYDTEDFKILAFLFEHAGFTFVARCKQYLY